MPAYKKQKDGDFITPVMKGYKMSCCDCGLVHRVDFKIIRRGKDYPNGTWAAEDVDDPTLRVELQVWRDNRATGQSRRHRK